MNAVIRGGSVRDLGGKAYALACLQNEGFAIPEWFAVSPEAFYRSLNRSQRAVFERNNLDDIGASLADVAPCPEVMAEIADALGQLSSCGRYAVRSSSADEDSARRSFAGQLESCLFVAPEQIADKIADVWRSAFSERVLAYRRAHDNPAALLTLPAVLVQGMIDAEAAGVAFSADPVSGRRGIAVVSAVFGLGTALVSGETDADTYEVDRSGTVRRASVATKKIQHRFNPATDGVSACELSRDQERARVLTDAQASSIAELARRVARLRGTPHDIEWAIEDGTVFLLQARPITTLRDLADPDAMVNIWDNSNITESYSGVTTPLTFSFARTAYEGVYREFARILKVPEGKIAIHQQTFSCMIGFIQGRVYYNLLNWYRVLALLPGFTTSRHFMEQMMGVRDSLPEEIAHSCACATVADRARDLRDLGRMLVAIVWKYCTRHRDVKRFYARLNRVLADPVPCLGDMRIEELGEHYDYVVSELIAHWDAPLANDLFTMTFHGLLRKLCRQWLHAGDALANALVRGAGEMISTEPAARLRELAALVASDPSLVRILQDDTPAAAVSAIRQIPELNERYSAYVAKFGDRCVDELKLESFTLHDDATPLLRSIGRLAAAGVQMQPTSAEPDSRPGAEQQVREALRGRALRRRMFSWILRNAREAVRVRENLRFERTRVFGRVRRVFIEIGRRLQALDLLEDARDIFYLQVEEVVGFIRGTAVTTDLKALVLLRRREFEQFRHQSPLADRFETYGAVYQDNSFQAHEDKSAGIAGEERRGLGCCSGTVRGRVRVINDPQGASLPVGSILVAERTDPGWVILFAAAAGLVVERGSLLSHSAIVAREMGIPAVVSVAGVTHWLRDGDLVELDGGTGLVRRIESEKAHAA